MGDSWLRSHLRDESPLELGSRVRTGPIEVAFNPWSCIHRSNEDGVAHQESCGQSDETEFIERLVFDLCFWGRDYEHCRPARELLAHNEEETKLALLWLRLCRLLRRVRLLRRRFGVRLRL